MIRSRKNERARRRIKIGRRSDNFRSWTKGFVRKKKKNQRRRKVPQKKKRKKKNTMKQDLRLVEAAANRLPTQSPITLSSFATIATASSFFSSSLSFFCWWSSAISSFSLNSEYNCYVFLFLSLDICFFTPFEFLSPSRANIGNEGFNFLIKAKNFQPLDLDHFFSCLTWCDMHW